MDIDYTTLMRDSDTPLDPTVLPPLPSPDTLVPEPMPAPPRAPSPSPSPSPFIIPSSSHLTPAHDVGMERLLNGVNSYSPSQTPMYDANSHRLPSSVAKADSLSTMFYLQPLLQHEQEQQQEQEQEQQQQGHFGFPAIEAMDQDQNQDQNQIPPRNPPRASSHDIPTHSSNSADDSTGTPNDITNDNTTTNNNASSPNLSLDMADIDTSNMTRKELTILRRKLRNRESAKRSRIKKEREIQELELKFQMQANEIDMLQKDNMRLRAQNQLLFGMIQRIQAGKIVVASGPNSGAAPGSGANDRSGYRY